MEMENSTVMNGGEGPNSYFSNSKFQGEVTNLAKNVLRKSIEEFLELQNDLHVFTVADLGCSVGPNTFSTVKDIIEEVQNKYSTSGRDQEVPEFLVFFNDQATNDFNTLFSALPSDRQYKAVGVPGSFHGRILPKSSMNLMHSAHSVHWLTKVPEEVSKEDSPLWNKGRITYALSSSEIGEAFRAQFFKDMEAFFNSRSEELVPGGLLAILVSGRPEGTSPSKSKFLRFFEFLGDVLADMANEGLISENLVDSFNLPIFFPSFSEVNQVVSSNKHLRIEKSEGVYFPPKLGTPKEIQLSSLHMRAVVETILCNHFGPTLIDELFNRYAEKLEKFSKTPHYACLGKLEFLFVLVKRIDAL